MNPDVSLSSQEIAGLMAVITPVIVGLIRTFAARLPKWLIPIIAPIIGAVGTTAINMDTSSIVSGAVAGLVGVGLREVYDQINKASKPTA